MRDFSAYLKASPYVTNTQSIADVVAKLNRALGGETDIPLEKEYVQQLWFLLGQQDLHQLITEDLDQALLIGKFNNEGQANIGAFKEYVNAYLREHNSTDFTIEVTGMPYVNAQLDRSLVKSQLTSLVIAIILVIALVSLIFKSFVEGLYAGVPIIATIAVLYGVMGLTGIPLNVVTVLVASVAMGIGIDYAIHYISHFNDALKRGFELDSAVEEAIMVSGKAILINFISVSAGFLILVFSDLMPMVYFGALIALSMLGSSMGALTLLPSILILGKKRQLLKDVQNQ
jgi:predicted RND superfamily exporter protein